MIPGDQWMSKKAMYSVRKDSAIELGVSALSAGREKLKPSTRHPRNCPKGQSSDGPGQIGAAVLSTQREEMRGSERRKFGQNAPGEQTVNRSRMTCMIGKPWMKSR